jgi:glutaredoxin-like protein NrdH
MAKKIKIYALSTCIWCKKTIEYFKKKGIPFEHIYVDLLDEDQDKQVAQELAKLNPDGGFPTVLIGDRVIIGYNTAEFEKECADVASGK